MMIIFPNVSIGTDANPIIESDRNKLAKKGGGDFCFLVDTIICERGSVILWMLYMGRRYFLSTCWSADCVVQLDGLLQRENFGRTIIWIISRQGKL